ncbi:peptidylprolyl isomerase, partial [Staphylococcus haemolyticus]
ATLEDIANTKVGAQDNPVHDVVIESIDVEDK